MTVLDVIREDLPGASEQDRLEDLGLDSLELLELQNQVEKKFSVRITDEEFTEAETIADLSAIVDRHLSD